MTVVTRVMLLTVLVQVPLVVWPCMVMWLIVVMWHAVVLGVWEAAVVTKAGRVRPVAAWERWVEYAAP